MRIIKNNPVVVLTTFIAFLALCALGYFINRDFSSKTIYNSDKFNTVIDQKDNAITAEFSSGGSQIAFTLADQKAEKTSDSSFSLGENVTIDYEIKKDGREQGLKETITLKNNQAPREFTFSLELKDIKNFTQSYERYWRFYNNSGKEVFYIPAGFMIDAKGERSEEVQITITENGSNYALKVAADPEWLNNSSRAYPVKIDPSIILSDDPPQEHSAHVYLAQWEWFCESGDECSWRAPGGGNVGVLDLRTLPQMSNAGGAPEGYGIFTYKELRAIPGSLYLGTDLNRPLTPAEKKAIEARLNIAMTSQTPLDAMWDMLTKYSDPTGQNGPKPLMPTEAGNMELYMGGFSLIKSKRLTQTSPEWPAVLAGLKEQYRRIRQEYPADVFKRVLGHWVQQYGLDYHQLIPADLPDEGMLEPHTTITDSFNRADADPLGTSSEGWSWAEVTGDIDIVTNEASQQGASVFADARAEFDLSTDDHYSQANVTQISACRGGMAVRFSAAAETTYGYIAKQDDTPNHRIVKIVTGVETALFTNNTNVFADGDVLRMEADGSLLTGLAAGVSRINGSDTSITGNLRAGILGTGGGGNRVQWDNFEAGDLPPPSTRIQGGATIKGGTKLQ